MLVGAVLALAGCASAPTGKSKFMFPEGSRWGEAAKRRYNDGEKIPPGGGRAMVGKPYEVDGKTYYPQENPNYDKVGMASWYGVDFHGRDTSNGEVYDRHTLSAAHTTLPLPSYARVTNTRNGKSVVVRINDRGPFVAGREIDLSEKAADMLGYKGSGVAQVRVQYVGPAPVEGSDQKLLASTFRESFERPSVASDRIMIARAEGRAAPASDRSVQVARLDLPTKAERPPLPSSPSRPVANVPALPPVAALDSQTRRPAQASVPQEILDAVRPQGKPAMASSFGGYGGAVQPAGTPALAPRRKPNPDDSLPLGWETPAKGARSYAADSASGLDAIFARVDRDAPGVTSVDLGLYADPARAARLRSGLAAHGTVSERAIRSGDGQSYIGLTLVVVDQARVADAVAQARRLGAQDVRIAGR